MGKSVLARAKIKTNFVFWTSHVELFAAVIWERVKFLEHVKLQVVSVLFHVVWAEARDHPLLLHFEFVHLELIRAQLLLLKYFLIPFPDNVLFVIILYLRNFGVGDLSHNKLFTSLLLDFVRVFLEEIHFLFLKHAKAILITDPGTTFVFIPISDSLFQLFFEILCARSSCRNHDATFLLGHYHPLSAAQLRVIVNDFSGTWQNLSSTKQSTIDLRRQRMVSISVHGLS